MVSGSVLNGPMWSIWTLKPSVNSASRSRGYSSRSPFLRRTASSVSAKTAAVTCGGWGIIMVQFHSSRRRCSGVSLNSSVHHRPSSGGTGYSTTSACLSANRIG